MDAQRLLQGKDAFAGPGEIASARSAVHRWGAQRLGDDFEPAIVAASVVIAAAQLCQMVDGLTDAQRSRMAQVCAETPDQPVCAIAFQSNEAAAVTAFEADQFLTGTDELYKASLLRYGLVHMAMVAGLADAPSLIVLLDLYEEADVTNSTRLRSTLRSSLAEMGLLIDAEFTFYSLVSVFLMTDIKCHCFEVRAPAPPLRPSRWRRLLPWRQ